MLFGRESSPANLAVHRCFAYDARKCVSVWKIRHAMLCMPGMVWRSTVSPSASHERGAVAWFGGGGCYQCFLGLPEGSASRRSLTAPTSVCHVLHTLKTPFRHRDASAGTGKPWLPCVAAKKGEADFCRMLEILLQQSVPFSLLFLFLAWSRKLRNTS